MKLGLIYARSRNGVIGRDGQMPWHLPEDFAHFRRKTMGAPVIMGRRTWDSLPPRFRPLPGRRNIVITRNDAWSAEGAEVASSVEAAIALCASEPLAWVLGGTQVFNQSSQFAHFAEVTEIDADFEGDTYAPVLGPEWREVARERRVSAGGVPFSFVTYRNERVRP